MTEGIVETEEKYTNPGGRDQRVTFDQVIKTPKGLTTRRLWIVETEDQKIDLMAINPKTGEKIDLTLEDWNTVYGQLQQPPPTNLAERLKEEQ